jgi:hypothetical protein
LLADVPRSSAIDTAAPVAMQVAGVRMVARSRDPAVRFRLSPTAQVFACETASPDILTTVTSADLTSFDFGDRLLFDSGALWQLWQDDAGPVLRFASSAFGPTPYKAIRLDEAWSRAEIAVHAGYPQYVGRPTDPFEYPLDELLITHWLARGRGIELHACGVVDGEGRGHLFCGQSGAGKSTTARTFLGAEPATVLSDDRIVVRHDGERFWMYGTPWHGDAELATAACAPVDTVLLLRQAPRPRLVPLPAAEAVARLLSCAFFPLYDAAAVAFAMDCLSQLVREVPCLELELARNAEFLPLLRHI